MSGGRLKNSLTPPYPSTKPQRPPAAASIRLSTSSCRTMRQRLAPRARRSVTSRVRSAARASNRLATLAQAISRTNPTAPRSSPKVTIVSPPKRGTSTPALPLGGASGLRLASAAMNPVNSALAWSIENPLSQASERGQGEESRCPIRFRQRRKRQPQLLVVRILEARRHDANHRRRHARYPDRAPDDTRIRAITGAPRLVAQDGDRRRPGAVVGLHEPSSDNGLHAEELEHVPGDVRTGEPRSRSVVVRDGHPRLAACTHQLQGRRRRLPVLEARVRQRAHPAGKYRHTDLHDPIRLRERKRPQDDSVDDREHRRVHRNADPERQDDRGGDTGMLPEGPESGAQILPEAAQQAAGRCAGRYWSRYLRLCQAPYPA